MNAIFTVSADAEPETNAMQMAAPGHKKPNFFIRLSPRIFESILSFILSHDPDSHKFILHVVHSTCGMTIATESTPTNILSTMVRNGHSKGEVILGRENVRIGQGGSLIALHTSVSMAIGQSIGAFTYSK
jgi:hypothetical protein